MYLCRLLPEELVNPILDYAEVYTVSVSSRADRVAYHDQQGAVWRIQNRQLQEQHWIYLVSKAIFGRVPHHGASIVEDEDDIQGESEPAVAQLSTTAREEQVEEVPEDPNARNPWKVKSVKVRTWSCDQGWTSEHFESDAVARGEEILPITLDIQRNKRGEWARKGVSLVTPGMSNPVLPAPADREVQHYEHELALDSPVIQQIRRGDKLVLLAKARYPVSLPSEIPFDCVILVESRVLNTASFIGLAK
ncbi:hypothetical protein QFC19_009286 [Naganishia cerealis]|uniref:Uncharacterized protein n=1 Tax=Naganishia cerealis TaxID=610337 RepID=A0ACC2UWF2_9TREE|nr:hypothetical protein QFC19_009286 [Naganishia cerealis]